MSLHFHSLKISNIRHETNDCVSIAFDIPPALKQVFSFREGQNITLRTYINGEDLRRSYSICSSPLEPELRVAIKSVTDGRFSQYANRFLKKGDLLEVLPPTGNFFVPLNASHCKQYVAFAAGSGITPVISLIKTILATEPQSKFTLVYGNRDTASIIFREELETIKNRYMLRFRLIHLLSREETDADILHGRINKEKCAQLSRLINWKNTDQFFLCGPAAMIFSVKDFLLSESIDATKIHFELFTVPGQQEPAGKKENPIETAKETLAAVTVRQDGRAIHFELGYHGKTILDAALARGADLPYSCKGGVCSTCRAKLVKGEVSMDKNFALEAGELESGFILTCQSHPRSANVELDFDLK